MLIWSPRGAHRARWFLRGIIFASLIPLLAISSCQGQLPQHPNDIALAYLRERAAGFPGDLFVAVNPGPVSAWAPAEYPLPQPCTRIILDREMFVIANTIGENSDQASFTFRYQEQRLWEGLKSTVLSPEGLVTTENSFGSMLFSPRPSVLWYQVRFRAMGGADGRDEVTQWLLMRPTAKGWKIFQRPEEIESRGGPVAQWSRVQTK